MKNLIKADLVRISRKWVLYLFLLIPLVMILFKLQNIKPENSFDYLNNLSIYFDYHGCFFFSMASMIAVYGDELRTGAMQTAIGRGLSRTKLILAKFLDCVILLFLQFTVLTIFVLITNKAAGIITSGADNLNIVMSALLCGLLPSCSYVAISALFIYTMWNAAVGFIAAFGLSILAPIILGFVKQLLKINLSDYWIRTLMDDSLNKFLMGSFDFALLPAIVVYIVLPLALTVFLFRRKELEL